MKKLLLIALLSGTFVGLNGMDVEQAIEEIADCSILPFCKRHECLDKVTKALNKSINEKCNDEEDCLSIEKMKVLKRFKYKIKNNSDTSMKIYKENELLTTSLDRILD